LWRSRSHSSDDQELALCHIIEREEAHGTHLRHWQLQNRTNWILAQDDPDSDAPTEVGKVVSKGGVLEAGEAAYRIEDRRKEEVELARRKAVLYGKRGHARQAIQRKLDFLAALDDPNRSAPRSERAVSL
jgi:hypothetical protein